MRRLTNLLKKFPLGTKLMTDVWVESRDVGNGLCWVYHVQYLRPDTCKYTRVLMITDLARDQAKIDIEDEFVWNQIADELEEMFDSGIVPCLKTE